jgi:hypothetical protein
VRRRKAAKPANRTARRPRRGGRSGGLINADATSPDFVMQALAVYDGSQRIGHLLPRGRDGFEAFSADTVSLGLFATMKAGADAVTKAAGGAA